MNDLYDQPRDGEGRTYRNWKNALHPDDLVRAEAEFADAIRTRGRYVSEFRVRLVADLETALAAAGYEPTDELVDAVRACLPELDQ